MVKELKEKIIRLQNYNAVIYKKLQIYKDTIKRDEMIIKGLKLRNKALEERVKEYEKSNNSRTNRE